MTIDEAIKFLSNPLSWAIGKTLEQQIADNKEATQMAIEALERQRWIPCSERMPEDREWIGTKRFGTTISDEVYVTFEAPDGQRFADHISFQNGKLSRSDAERMRVWYKGAKPIAWKPLPESYKGVTE